MDQTQNGFQCANERAPSGTLLRGVTRVDLYLGNFQVPIAEFVPNEVINDVGHVVQAVLGKAFGHIGFHALNLGGDPAIGLAEAHVTMRRTAHSAFSFGVFFQAAILPLAVHQDKACGVPQLVAKIAIAFAAFAVKVDTASEGGQCCKREAQSICTVRGNSFGKFFLCVLAHLRGRLGLAQTL